MMIRNEEDIIAKNLEHHINRGVSGFIISDNNSEDRTRSIIERYPEVLEIIDIPDEDHPQSKVVTLMARKAIDYKPDWIVHIDADELWDGFQNLNFLTGKYYSSCSMLLHPPTSKETFESMLHFIDLDPIRELPQESKVFHRPDPDIVITHGNHGFENIKCFESTKRIWRHHYPIRSYKQLAKKAIQGHESLLRRNAICERWKKWYDLEKSGCLHQHYLHCCTQWEKYISTNNIEHFLSILPIWSTPEAIKIIEESKSRPLIGMFQS